MPQPAGGVCGDSHAPIAAVALHLGPAPALLELIPLLQGLLPGTLVGVPIFLVAHLAQHTGVGRAHAHMGRRWGLGKGCPWKWVQRHELSSGRGS